MSVSSLNSIWGAGPQTAKGVAATTFYAFRAMRVAGGPQELAQTAEPEVGGQPLPDAAYKVGVFTREQIDLYMRLEDDIGWLLYALTGAVSTTADTPESGMHTHTFRMDPTSTLTMLTLKWLSTRRIIGQPAIGHNFGMQVVDNRIEAMMFNLAAAAALTCRMNMLGRTHTLSDDPSAWTWAASSPEGFDSVPISANTNSHFKVPDFSASALPTQQVQIQFGNVLTQPTQEFIIGSPYMDDIAALYRNIGLNWTYKWYDEDLYLYMVANGGTGTSIDWSAIVPSGSFEAKISTPQNVSGMSNPYSITFAAPEVFWFPTAPPSLSGLNLIQLPVSGIVAATDDGSDPFTIQLVNETSAYTWPT